MKELLEKKFKCLMITWNGGGPFIRHVPILRLLEWFCYRLPLAYCSLTATLLLYHSIAIVWVSMEDS